MGQEKIGSLWQKKTKNGDDYFSGVIGGKNVVVFQNSYKEKDSQPDWIVYPGKGRDEGYRSPYPKDEEEVPF